MRKLSGALQSKHTSKDSSPSLLAERDGAASRWGRITLVNFWPSCSYWNLNIFHRDTWLQQMIKFFLPTRIMYSINWCNTGDGKLFRQWQRVLNRKFTYRISKESHRKFTTISSIQGTCIIKIYTTNISCINITTSAKWFIYSNY